MRLLDVFRRLADAATQRSQHVFDAVTAVMLSGHSKAAAEDAGGKTL